MTQTTLLILLFNLLSFLTGAAVTGDPVRAELLFVGDAMQHQAQLDQARKLGKNGNYDYSSCFSLIAPTVMQADYAVCNLEVPLGGGPTYSGYPCFSAPDSYAEALRDAGFDMMLTANNHCLDRGDRAARRTLLALDSLGIDHTGTFHDADSRRRQIPLIREIKGIRFGFLNYTYGTNGIPPRQGMEVAMIDRDRMAEEISATRRAGAEIIVVAVHWGVEYVLRENRSQRELAAFLVDQGVDMVIGSHPHVIQPMEIVRNEKEGKDVLVVYSLGNFLSNMKTGDTRGGALVKVAVERDSDGKARLRSAEWDTLFAAKPEGDITNFTVIPSSMADRIPVSQKGHWLIFDKAARRIFSTYNKNVNPVKASDKTEPVPAY